MSQEVNGAITLGVVVKDGALIVVTAAVVYFVNLANSWRQRRKEETEKISDIIGNVVSYVSKANDIIDEFSQRKTLFLKTKGNDPEAIQDYKKYINRALEKLSDFGGGEAYYTYQLLRVGNQALLQKFKALLKAYVEYAQLIRRSERKPKNDLESNKQREILRLFENFVFDCSEMTKINAPKRTLSAPAKKKGPTRKG
jgi:hypothetical protein